LTAPRDALREYIAAPSTRSALSSYARRRGLHDSAEDVVQTVLCDALAVAAVPVESDELPRWLNGIARHKVADEHRRRARWSPAEPSEGSCVPSEEAEDLLRRIDGEVVEPEERQALEWLVREHQGEALCEMARAEALAPDTLRQRVARFRRKLRARYLAPLAMLVALGGGGALWASSASRTQATLTSASALAAFAGDWRVIDVAPASYRSLTLRVRIGAQGVRVLAAEGVVGRDLNVEALGEARVRISSGSRAWTCRVERIDDAHFKLVSERGFVLLERQR
jgi:DNA-directed RNA polymerase specialized sigma24 family protein